MSRVLVGVDDLSRRSFHGDLRIRIEIYITQEIIIHVFLLSIIVAGVYSRPRPIELVHVETGPVVVLLHVEVRAASYARCQNRASSFRGTALYFFTSVTGPVVLGLCASTRIESTASRYYRP